MNYSHSSASTGAPLDTTVANIEVRARAERFFGDHWSVFFIQKARHDRFQGLDLRLDSDPGLARYFMNVEGRRFWGELGYDLQLDVRHSKARLSGADSERAIFRHATRAFLGYEHQFDSSLQVSAGAEYIQTVTDVRAYRFTAEAAILSPIVGGLSSATTIDARFDNAALPDVARYDITTMLSLIYTL